MELEKVRGIKSIDGSQLRFYSELKNMGIKSTVGKLRIQFGTSEKARKGIKTTVGLLRI